MAGAEFRITGDKAIDRALKNLPRNVQRKVLRQAIRASVKIMRTQAEANMPRDTGVAADALQVRARKGAKRGTIAIDVQYDADKVTANSPNQFFYPAVIEFGSEALDRPPDAPMRRAYDERGEEARQEALRRLRDGIIREAAALREKGST